MKDLNVLFLGGIFPKENEKDICKNSKGAIQNAANVLQWNFIEGFDQNLETPLTIINSLFIGSYPKRYKKLFVKSYPFSHNGKSKDFNVGFCNLMGFKKFSIIRTLKKAVKKWIKNTPGKKSIVAYAMTGTRLSILKYAKKVDSSIHTSLIVPDLPQYMHFQKVSKLFSLMKKLDGVGLKKNLKYVDSFVLLTEKMAEYLNVKNYVVVEGIAKERKNMEQAPNNSCKTIVYAGGLNLKYGVGDLVDAFGLIKDEHYRLILCGSGNAVEKIEEQAKTDKRIEYKGLLPHNEVLKLVHSATVLVNPRKNNEEYTKYSFPSKTMEYMSTGVPIVAYKLDGIPNEYDEYLNYVQGDSIEDFAKKIIEICEKTEQERIAIGQKAKNFILNNKNAKVQVEKVLNMIERKQ